MVSELLSDTPPEGPAKLMPLSAEDIDALLSVVQRGAVIADAIRRAHHIGLDVSAHAARHEMHQGVAQRILAMYAPPKLPIEE